MIKLLGIIMILASSTIIGFLFGENLKKRFEQLNEFERAINHLQNEIIYAYTSLPEAIINVSEKSGQPIKNFLKDISECLSNNEVNSVYEAFEISYMKNKNNFKLHKNDIDVLITLSKTLGECDIDGEKRMFELTLDNLRKQIDYAENNMNKSLKMYRYLGFSVGAAVVIILL